MATNQVSQGNGPKDLNISKFLSILDTGGSLAKACRYMVVIRPPQSLKTFPSRELHYLCEAASLPGRGFSVTETRTYGPTQMFPTNSEYQPAALTFICRADSSERRFFDDWQDYINPTNTFNFQYPESYYAEIDIYQYSEWGQGPGIPHITYHWRLMKAWPTLVNEQPVNWADQEVLRLQVSFAYKYWERPTLQ